MKISASCTREALIYKELYMKKITEAQDKNKLPCEGCVFCTRIVKNGDSPYAICSPSEWMGDVRTIHLDNANGSVHCPRFSAKK